MGTVGTRIRVVNPGVLCYDAGDRMRRECAVGEDAFREDAVPRRGESLIEPPYLTYSRYLRERHGCKVYRVAVDAGFGCPNRAGGRSGSGCSYCSQAGSRSPYLQETAPADAHPAVGCREKERNLKAQIDGTISFLKRRYSAEGFILYFQPYSNTNAPVEELKQAYDSGLALARFRGLNVATRPDCIDAGKARLLSSYREKGLEVWVELGLQTIHDATLRRIGRGHTAEDFRRACGVLKEHGLNVAVHLIFGLPGEGFSQIMETVEEIARLGLDGVKIHNLHIPRGTPLEAELLKGEVTVPSAQRHLAYCIAAIERLPPRIVVMRLVCDTPRTQLSAPRSFWRKEAFTSRLAAEMRSQGSFQGKLFRPLDRASEAGLPLVQEA
jgi:radical SAM protein (TIGR01212 family)